jgi:uncharacterized membrane protein YedE/YeeE
MENFTPWSSLAGGALIGLAAAIKMVFNGRIAGVSGIVGGLLSPAAGDIGWRLMFVAGLVLAGVGYSVFYPGAFEYGVTRSHAALVVAGLLVGIGTRLGTGCTSGHGVCGISRFSGRSIVATLTFMATGFATVLVINRLLGGGV